MTLRDEIIARLTSLGDKLPYFRFGQLVLACILPTKADDLWSVTDIDLLKGVRHFSELPYFQGLVESRNPARSDLVDFDLRQQFLGQLSSILALEPSLRFVQLLELLAWLARGSKCCVYSVEDRELRDAAELFAASLEGRQILANPRVPTQSDLWYAQLKAELAQRVASTQLDAEDYSPEDQAPRSTGGAGPMGHF